MTKIFTGLFVLALAVACTQTPPPAPPPPPDPNAIVRLEVSPAALLMTAAKEKHPLTVRALNAAGQPVPQNAPVTWTSSRPEQVSVSASGELEAQVALGSSQVVAQMGGVTSAPVLISVAQPAAGVTLVTDAQIRGEPSLVDPNAEFDSDNPYEVVLTGIAAPAPGSLLLGSEGKSVGGEVVSSISEGDAVRVRLKTVPISRLMQTAQIKETVDYTNLPLSLPPEVTRDYDVKQTGDEYVFTPKPAASARVGLRPQVLTEFQLGPYKCDFATPELPISLGQPGQFSLKFSPSLEVEYDSNDGLKRLVFKGDLTAKIKASIVISAGGLLNLDCAAKLYEKLAPLPGWAGLVLAGELSAGLGFEIEGTVSFPLGGVELSSETKMALEIGMDCASGECKLVRNINPVNTNDLRFVRAGLDNIRPAELFIFGYGFAKLKAGMTLIDKARMDLLTARAGLKLEGSFAPPSTQLAPSTNALEPDYQSSYKLNALAEVVAGSINKTGDSAFRKILQKLGIFKFNILKAQFSKTLATSPKGSATQDKSAFKAGDTVKFNVKLDPSSAVFPFIGYNVERIVIMRRVAGSPAEEIASVNATPDQTDFTLPWTADEGSPNPRGSEYYAFVDTKLPVPFDLELGKVVALKPSVASELFTGTVSLTGSFQDVSTLAAILPNAAYGTSRKTFDTTLTAQVQFNPANPNLNRILSKNATINGTESSEHFSSVQTFGAAPCTVRERTGSTATISGSSLTPNSLDGGLIRFTGTTYTLEIFRIVGRIKEKGESLQFYVPVQTPCQEIPAPRVVPFEHTPEDFYLPDGVQLSGTGEVVVNPDGSKTIAGTRTVNETGEFPSGSAAVTNTRSVNYTLTWDLRTPPAVNTEKPVDLELDIVAPASAAPEGNLTYAVNLHNKSANAANDIRAEFALPEGFTVVDTQGWSGCVTVLTTVTCKASSLAANERRAFLIDVKAPASIGEYVVSARVGSFERDTNSSDNFDTGVTLIAEP